MSEQLVYVALGDYLDGSAWRIYGVGKRYADALALIGMAKAELDDGMRAQVIPVTLLDLTEVDTVHLTSEQAP